MKKVLSTLLTFCLVLSISVPAFAGTDTPTEFKADKAELALINQMTEQGYSKGEILQRVAPEYYSNLPKLLKDKYDSEKYAERSPLKSIDQLNMYATRSSSTNGISLSNRGGVMKWSTSRSLSYQSAIIAIDVEVKNDDSGNIEYAESSYKENTSSFSMSGYVSPPTGTYYAWTQHTWEHQGHAVTDNGTSLHVDFVNPY